MLPYLSITGISLFIILLYFNVRKYPSSVYLGIFFLLISLHSFHQYVTFYSKSVFLVSIIFVNIGFLFYLIGPMLYWYIRSLLKDNAHLNKKDFWHLLPMLIFLLTSLPHVLMPYANKLRIATKIVEDPDYLGTYHATAIYEFISPSVVFLSRPLLILCYTIFSIIFFIRWVRQRGTSYILSRQYFMTGWIIVLLGFTFLLTLSHSLMVFKTYVMKDSGLFFSLNLLQILSISGLTGLIISPFFFPRILYGLPRLPETEKTMKINGEEHDSPQEESKRHTLNFESEYLQYIGQKADACMKELQPYLHADFNLTQLSVLIHIPVHHLTYYFREEKKQSFHDYRDIWRINHAEKLISEGMATEITLEAIGLQSGFSTRNTFFTAFKKAEGISPGVFAAKFST
jgi:AraC-like DNA-binding protein